jgi:ABC-2 type transport system ATP-binding protein
VGSTAVSVETVSKRFRLYHEKYSSLKEKVIHIGRIPYTDLWALRDVAFEVKEGETLGILGRNGSGKSTLLKCVCGVLQPTSGRVVVKGKLAGLLELGAGFQQELSGRDNIYLNGSMLGLSKREVDRMFDDIVEFAELGQFIDNQVKFYSSGMYVRLGFAVAVNVDPDVLVIDEVLAVGDERFQRKCIDRVKQFQKDGRTILFVSHSADMVRSLCDRAVVLSDGEVIGSGTPGEAVRVFRERLLEAGDVLALREEAPPPAETPAGGDAAQSEPSGPAPLSSKPADETHPVRLGATSVLFAALAERPYLVPGESVTVRVPFEASQPVHGAVFQLEVVDSESRLLYRTDTEVLGMSIDLPAGPGSVDFEVLSVPMSDGAYEVSIGVQTPRGLSDWQEPACRFEVMNPGRSSGTIALSVRTLVTGADGPVASAEPA